MRPDHCTVTPAVVRALVRQAIARILPWKGYGRLATADKILDVLVLACVLASSLSAVVKCFAFGFSHETARNAVAANLPELPELTEGLLGALYAFGSRRNLRRRAWVLAIDEHRNPFYGDRDTPGVTGGQKKHGSKYAFAYATAVLVHKRHRLTVGLLPLPGGEKPHRVVGALLDQVSGRGLKLRGVVLDSGFDSGETILLLQGRGTSYAVPLRKKGKGTNSCNAAWDLGVGSVTEVSWKTEAGNRPVSTRAVVLRRPGEKDKKVYAFGGWGEGQACSAGGACGVGAEVVPEAVRDRDELPADARVQGEDDHEGRALPPAVGRPGADPATGVGVPDGASGPRVGAPAQRMGRRPAARPHARLARLRTQSYLQRGQRDTSPAVPPAPPRPGSLKLL